ncbi:aldose epimerase family protein [Pedobacter sp. B4-66]|uniref:aldose epimerase family protein n=1 Tax=Pedobacter sp. B4-66 TaxID=2817280 RepID=UPI001BD9148C
MVNSRISRKLWGNFSDKNIYLFKIKNKSGAFVELTNYGATIVSIVVPDKNNTMVNVILGFPELQGYIDDDCYLGSTVGRFANRISKATFSIDEIWYKLEANDNGNTNHSASAGFNNKVFDYTIEDDKLILSLLSKDGDGGYPGNLLLKVCYQWTDLNELLISYTAETDKKTIVNITNHNYFNLSGGGSNFFNHELTINATSIVEATDDFIPTGAIVAAGDIEFKSTKMADRITDYLNKPKGLNICYVLNIKEKAATLRDPQSGRSLEIYTTYPGLMLYTGDYLRTKHPGHLGVPYKPFDGLCLECQYYPDSPNQPDFPSTILHPGHIYQERITYKFSTEHK